jgi:hypothetical protein
MASKVSRQLIVWIVSAGLVGASLFIGAFAQGYDPGIFTKNEFIGKVQGGIEAPPSGQDHIVTGECFSLLEDKKNAHAAQNGNSYLLRWTPCPGKLTSENWHPKRLYQVTREGNSEQYEIDTVGWTDGTHNAHEGKLLVLERVLSGDNKSMPRAYRICFDDDAEECNVSDDHPGHGTVR